MHNACLMLKTQPETRQLVLKNPLHSAFHNLCDAETKLPREIKSLLGLGLNFCQNPTSTTPSSKIQLDRIEKDYYRRIMFAFQPPPDRETKLYSPDPHWTPKEPNPDCTAHIILEHKKTKDKPAPIPTSRTHVAYGPP